MNRTPHIPDDCQWCTFLRNHDELTLEMVTEEEREILWSHYAPEQRMRLNLGIRRRLAPLMGGDAGKIELLYAILFSLPGAPIIYYGDEIGMGDNICLNDRDGVRTPMQWSAGPNAGFSEQAGGELFLPVIDEGPFDYRKVNVESQMKDEQSLLNRLRNLMAVRKAHPVFSSQRVEFIHQENPAVLSVRREGQNESILCLHNLSAQAQTVSPTFDRYRLLQASSISPLSGNTVQHGDIRLEPYTYVWLIQAGNSD
jgi:maltose alpha-D-glucosyltransferase/alpha-amylase